MIIRQQTKLNCFSKVKHYELHQTGTYNRAIVADILSTACLYQMDNRKVMSECNGLHMNDLLLKYRIKSK